VRARGRPTYDHCISACNLIVHGQTKVRKSIDIDVNKLRVFFATSGSAVRGLRIMMNVVGCY
jgi:hypothetical protein